MAYDWVVDRLSTGTRSTPHGDWSLCVSTGWPSKSAALSKGELDIGDDFSADSGSSAKIVPLGSFSRIEELAPNKGVYEL